MKNRAGNFITQVLLLVSLVVDLGFPPALQPQKTLFLTERRSGLLGVPEDSTKAGPVSSPAI